MSALQEMTGRAVIVLGMHRSGTSMVTRCVHLLGADIAHQVIPIDAAINRDGFFEDAKVVAFNDELLSMLGSSWYDFRPLRREAEDLRAITGWQKQALAHVREEYAGKKLSVTKDPRISRLWTYWAPVFKQAGLNVDLIHIVRQPEQVAMSLQRRNGMPPVYGVLLWCAHIIDMLNTMDNEASWTTLLYDSFLADPHKNIECITAMLGTDSVGTPDHATIEGGIGAPRHSICASNGDEFMLNRGLHDFASQLYQLLENGCTDGKLVLAQNEIARLNSGYQQLLSRYAEAFQMLRVLTNDRIALNGELVKIGELHSRAQSVVAERDGQLAALNGELKRVGAELEYAQSVVEERDAQIATMSEQSGVLREIARSGNAWLRRVFCSIRHFFPR